VKFLIAIAITFTAALGASTRPASSPAKSMSRKLAHLESNGKQAHPNSAPTILTDREVNAYLTSRAARMPAGVQSVKLQATTGVISGNAQVDFDKVRAGIHSSNALLSVFSGVHDVQVVAHAYGELGMGYVHVDSVSLDGVEVPHFILELFVEKCLTPRYPDVGLDSKFKMAERIDSAIVGDNILTVVQK